MAKLHELSTHVICEAKKAICIKSANGKKYFLKYNLDQKNEILFRGEFEGKNLA